MTQYVCYCWLSAVYFTDYNDSLQKQEGSYGMLSMHVEYDIWVARCFHIIKESQLSKNSDFF